MSKKSSYLLLDFGVLNNVKLVLGNGFDLACGLKSSYASFFESQSDLYNEIDNWIANKGKFPNDATAWDLLFLILSKENEQFKQASNLDWKDIENVMKQALVGTSNTIPYTFKNVIDKVNLTNPNSKLIFDYLASKVNIDNIEEAYEFLYQELIRFEKRFTDYLRPQEKDPIYNENARRMLTESGLLKMKTDGEKPGLISIDSFNYTTPEVFNELRGVAIRHINGKIGSAIFGIDSEGIKVNEPAYRFTKAYRKMIDLANGGREEFKRGFKNIVIYGHSLSEADYSYFYSVLDGINLDVYKEYASRIVYAFTDYGKTEEENLKNRRVMSENLIKLISGYDHWKNPESARHGMVEMLETSDRIGFAKVDTSVLKK